MARLHEYQGKEILAAHGFKIPRGWAAHRADEAVAAAKELAGKNNAEVVIKIQAWTTGRAGIGGVAFAKKPDEVHAHAARMLTMTVGQFPVEAVLVEEKVAITREFFLSFAINDAARAPTIIFAAGGGTGIEERADSARRITSSPRAMINAPSEIRCSEMPRYSSATNVIASTSGIARGTTNPGRRPRLRKLTASTASQISNTGWATSKIRRLKKGRSISPS